MPSTKRKASAKKQQPITQHVLPLLKKPMEQIGKQINVPGSFWDGRMSTDERNTFYKCDSRSTSSCSSRSPLTLRTRPTSSSTSRARYSAGVKIVAGMHTLVCPLAASLARLSLTCSLYHVNARLFTSGLALGPQHLGILVIGGHQQVKVHAVRQGNQGVLLFQISRQGRRARRACGLSMSARPVLHS